MGIQNRRRLGLAVVPGLAAVAALWLAPGAGASTIVVNGSGVAYDYTAAPGEENSVQVSSDGRPFGELTYSDAVTIDPVPASCAKPVPTLANCDYLGGDAGSTVALGDLDDRFSALGGEYNTGTFFGVFGGEGDDRINGAVRGDALLSGGPGDDLVDGEPARSSNGGADMLDGSTGVDTVSFDDTFHSSEGVTVDLAAGEGGTGGVEDDLTAFENILGSKAPDILIGDDGPNEIDGNRGRDKITAGDGDDIVVDESGKSTVDCGPGQDKATVLKSSAVKKNCEKVKFVK